MTRKSSLALALLAVFVLVGVGGLAFWFSSDRPASAGPAAKAPLAPARVSLESNAEHESEALIPARAEKAPAAGVPVAGEERHEAGEAELAEAIWVEGRVVFPPDTPLGEVVEVVADGRKFENRELHRARVAADGRFRVAFSKRTKNGRLKIDAPHLYLPRSTRLRLKSLPDEIVLEPEVGGRITGVLLPPSITSEERGKLRERSVGLQGWLQSTGQNYGRTSRLDENLAFDLRGIPPMPEYELEFDCGFLPPHQESNVRIGPGEDRRLEIELSLGARIQGSVLDETGATLEGVKVFAWYQRWRGTWTSNESREAEIAADGSFAIQGVPVGEVTIVGEKVGYVDAHLKLGELAEGDLREGVALVMQRGHSVSGTVSWPDGRPVAQATVTVEELQSGSGFSTGGMVDAPPSNIDGNVAKTAADGSFKISGLGEGPFTIEARAKPDWDPEQDQAGASGDAEAGSKIKRKLRRSRRTSWTARAEEVQPGAVLALTLTSGLGIEGEVFDDLGARLDRFSVRVTPYDPAQPWVDWNKGTGKSFKDADGYFRLEGLNEGQWRVTVDARGHTRSSAVIVDLPDDVERLHFALGRSATLSGNVYQPDGLPAARARIEISRTESEPWLSFNGDEAGVCEKDGSFEIDAPVGEVTLKASLAGFAASEGLRIQLAPAQRMDGISLELRRGGSIAGKLVDAAGSVSGREISIHKTDGGVWESTSTNASGEFGFEHLEPAEYQVDAPPAADELEGMLQENGEVDWMAREAATQSAVVSVRDGETSQVVIGVLSKDAVRLHGVVRRGSRTVEGARIWCNQRDGSGHKAAVTDAQGRYELTLDAPGQYYFSVSAADSDGVNLSHDEEIPAVADYAIDFELHSGRISGTVVGPEGPVAQVRIQVTPARGVARGQAFYGHAVSAEDGAFEFVGLPGGIYDIEAGRGIWGRDSAWGTKRLEALELAENGVMTGLVIELEPAGTIEGTVSGPDGSPVAGADVIFSGEDGRAHMFQARSDGTGRFRQGGLGAGTWVVRAHALDRVSAYSAPVTLRPGGDAEVHLTLEAGTLLRVKARDPAGQPVNAKVTIRDAQGRIQTNVYTQQMRAANEEASAEAGYAFGPYPLGDYTVIAERDGARAEGAITLRSGPEQEIVLALEKQEQGKP